MGIDFLFGIENVDFDSEIWKNVDGFPDFKISSLGSMIDNRTGGKAFTKIKDGYRYVNMNCPTTGVCKERAVHRLVALHFIETEQKKIVDHINGNRLDNRLCNLRYATDKENSYNKSKTKSQTSSKFKGVSCERGKFKAQVWKDNKVYNLGRFETEVEAGQAYNKKAFGF